MHTEQVIFKDFKIRVQKTLILGEGQISLFIGGSQLGKKAGNEFSKTKLYTDCAHE